jgi:hypothetical protein
MPRNTVKQTARLRAINEGRRKLTAQYAFRMRPVLVQWEAEGLTQREVVTRLNETGAVVPSEYTGARTRPSPIKQWSLSQYQRFRKAADAGHEAMVWWAKRNRRPHVRPFGDGAGLFADPLGAGLPFDPNERDGTSEQTLAAAESKAPNDEPDPEAVIAELRSIDENYETHFPLDYAAQVRYRQILAEEKQVVAAGDAIAERDAQRRASKRAADEKEQRLKDPAYRRHWNREQAELARLNIEEMWATSQIMKRQRANGELPPQSLPPLLDDDELRRELKLSFAAKKKRR